MFILPDLPYPYEALEPVLSAELMHFHHDKHHATYVNNVNKFLADQGKTAASMEELVRSSKGVDKKMFNNAGQSWNHAFFWECMTGEAGRVGGALAEAIDKSFGGLAALKTKFVEEGAGHFGSGWVWLVAKGSELSVVSTHDGDCILTEAGVTPILVCDVWEHAYYLVHKNDRKGFLEKWFDSLANWGFAERQFAAAQGQGQGYTYPKPS
jgi:Fe-Mn family superoxide dismutase